MGTPIERVSDTDPDDLRGDPDNPAVAMQQELMTVLDRYNVLRQHKPGWVAALLVEYADTLRDIHNLDHEVQEVADGVYVFEIEGQGGWLGAPRTGEYGDVDEDALKEMVEGGEA